MQRDLVCHSLDSIKNMNLNKMLSTFQYVASSEFTKDLAIDSYF